MKKAAIGALALAIALAAYAGQEEMEIEEIVVTPLRAEALLREVPAAVTVIGPGEIERAGGRETVDLLRGRPGVMVRDPFGGGRNAAVDLRGFGEFGSVNTLLLIDGRRTNAPDLSGADWSQVPLHRIERIEIIRGSGTVLYGDNAGGGVINIITRPGGGEPRGRAAAGGGSFGERRASLGWEGETGPADLSLGASHRALDGWRKNSDLRGFDGGGRAGLWATEAFSLEWHGHYHYSRYGLPGALRESDLEVHGRRHTAFPDDRMKVDDWYQALRGRAETGPAAFTLDLSFRRRDIASDLESSFFFDRRDLEVVGINPGAEVEAELTGLVHRLSGGLDFYSARSGQDAMSFYGRDFYRGEKVRRTAVGRDTVGLFAQDRINWNDLLIVTAGWRREWADYDFRSDPRPGPWEEDPYWDPSEIGERLRVDREAASAGLTLLAAEEFSAFISLNRGFRFPATDEFFSVWADPPVNRDLKPQTWVSWELGFDARPLPGVSLTAAVFRMDLENELYYDPLTFSNRNYDRTRREGLETALKWSPLPRVSFGLDWTLLTAAFRGGAFDGNRVPMVPGSSGRLTAGWSPLKGLEAELAGHYVGRRRFLNDQENRYSPLGDYTTFDLALSYRTGDLSFFAGVENIFDREYSELGAIASFPEERAYYPAPGRRFFGGAELVF